MILCFAVLGAGRIGHVHDRAIASTPDAGRVAIADPVMTAAEAVRAQDGGTIASIDEILADKELDAIVICTPTDTYAELIERGALVDPEIGELGHYDSLNEILRTASGKRATIINSRRAANGAEIADCIATTSRGRRHPPRTGGHDGFRPLALADAASRSVEEQRVVAVSDIIGALG